MHPLPRVDPRYRMAGAAFWAMLRRLVVVAAGIHAALLLLYATLGSPAMAVLNVASLATYATIYLLIGRRHNKTALALIWVEVLVHAAIGSLLIGWASAFGGFLLLLVPATVMGASRRQALALVALLLVFYLGLDALCAHVGALAPLPASQGMLARWVNSVMVFGAFYAMADHYRAKIAHAERRLRQMATTDPLTGLANRTQFHERAQIEIARCRRAGQAVSLLLCDVDFFKRVNDQYGHDAGDKVLVRLAELMRDSLRETDVLARWGGEEFIALLPDCDEAAAVGLAERVRHAVATTPIEIGGRAIDVTMSLGIAGCNDVDDLQSATARADLALYASKRGGRNCVSVSTAAATKPDAAPARLPEPAPV